MLGVAGDRGSRQTGGEAEWQFQLATLGIERVVDSVTGRIAPIAPEAWPHLGVGHRVVGLNGGERTQGGHRMQQIQPADAQGEPFRESIHVGERSAGRLSQTGE